MYIHREGKRYVIIATIIFILLCFPLYRFTVMYPIWGVILWTAVFLLYFWVWWFFRIPAREYVAEPQAIFAPADGEVVVIEEVEETEYFKQKMIQISTFMSPLNVHVNRNPITGHVAYYKYHEGKYLVAWHPKSSTENERTSIAMVNDHTAIMVRQIAGAVARRIVCYVEEGDHVVQQDEFGFIKFGSRVDVFVPVSAQINVKIGEKPVGGQTVLAYI